MKRFRKAGLALALVMFAAQGWAQESPADSSSDLDAMLGTEQSDPAPEPATTEASSAEPAAAPEQAAEPAPVATLPVEELPPEKAVPTKRASARNVLIEEIVVTAQKREESINDVPISISAFSGDALKALGVTDTRDLGNLVPGFTATDSGFNTPVYTLRGVGFNDATYTATATVGVYVDEINLPYSIMTKGAALDLERVEVLKGPQGILYGRNTTGGAINYIAKKPTEAFEAGLSGTFGRFQTAESEGYISGNIAEGLNGRIAGKVVHSWQGSQYSNTRPDDTLGKVDKQSARAALEWAAGDTLSMRLVAEAWNDASEPRAAQAVFISEQNASDPAGIFLPPQARDYPTVPQRGANPQVADWNPDEDWQLHDRFYLGALRTDWQLSDATKFTGLFSAMRVKSSNSTIPQSGFNFNNAEQVIDAYINTMALEMRLTGTGGADDAFDWMVGTNLSRDRADEYHVELVDSQSAFFPDPVTGISTFGNKVYFKGTPKTNQYAGFVNAGWKFSENFKLSIGSRYTQTNENYTGCSGEPTDTMPRVPGVSLSTLFVGLSAMAAAQYTANTGMPGSPDPLIAVGDCFALADNGSTDPYTADLNESNLSYRLALDWKPTDDYLFYVSAGRGYKAGGFPVLPASSQNQLTPVTQEKLQAYEIGSKTSFLEKLLHLNVAAYNYDYKDKQLLTKALDPVFGPLPVLRNAPKSKIYGVEGDLQLAPAAIEGLFLAATIAYTHTEVKEFIGLNAAGDPTDLSGRPFNFAPKLQYTLVANYTIPVSDALNAIVGGDYYHSGPTNATVDGDPRFAFNAYGLIGARLGVAAADGRWTLTAFGRNLTNEFSTIASFQNGDAVSRIAGAARTYGITAAYNWGDQ